MSVMGLWILFKIIIPFFKVRNKDKKPINLFNKLIEYALNAKHCVRELGIQ